MIDGSDIRFVKWGAVMWAMYNPHYIAIDNVVEWMEWFITISLTHEFIHLLLDELEGYDTTKAFDNLFGLVDPSVMLCPQDDIYYYDRSQRKRTENLWK